MEREIYRGYTIRYERDEDAESPREWDNLGKMVCFHRRYRLGDKHGFTLEEAQVLENSKEVTALPLYLYDHSGITIATRPFSCPWDSGKVGFIYASKEAIRQEFGAKRITKEMKEKTLRILEQEVKTYDQFLRGEVYGYVLVSPSGEEVDSCWGFFGYEDMRGEVHSIVDRHLTEAAKEAATQMDIDAFPQVGA